MTRPPDQLNDDAKLTAYVLGELSEEDAAAIEQRLETDEALREEVQSIRETTALLKADLAAEPSPGLTDDQRAAIVEGGRALRDERRPVIFTYRRVWGAVGLAAAACLVLAIVLPSLSTGGGERQFAIDKGGEPDVSAPGKEQGGRGGGGPRGEKRGASAEPRIEQLAEAPQISPSTVRMEDVTGTLNYVDGSPAEGEEVAAAEVFGQSGGDAARSAGGGPGRESPADMERRRLGRAGRQLAPSGETLPTGGRVHHSPPLPREPAPLVEAPAGQRPAPGGGIAGPGEGAIAPKPDARDRGAVDPGEIPQPLAAAQVDAMTAEEIKHHLVKVARARIRLRSVGGNENAELQERLKRERDWLMQRLREIEPHEPDREGYGRLVDNPFTRPVGLDALSTFSIDVDTASYANVRRMLNAGHLPPADAVRIEEMINYFDYAYEPASGEQPFSVNVEVNAAPWKPDHRLVRIGLKGLEVEADMRPATSLVFLIDVSGSMNHSNKLPQVRESMKLLVENLIADDRIAIVTYAGNAGLVLDSTYCDEKGTIINAIDRLRPGGSTHGSAGIQLAYDVAQEHFIEGGVNRVILCTDGDFNVGTSSEGELIRLIEQKRESGVFLSVLGFGTGNFQDQKMEMLSNHGNGNFAYIDSIDEAKKALVEEMAGTLVTIAKDVKIQVDFNPAKVGAYRLIGYANRMLEARDFDDDKKDAGEIGAGHTVTALYEIIPADGDLEDIVESPESDFVKPGEVVESDLLLKVKLRYKEPDGDVSTLVVHDVTDEGAMTADATGDFQFAAAVASFGMVLRNSEHKGDATYATVLDLAAAGLGDDEKGRRAAFIQLVEKAKRIAGN